MGLLVTERNRYKGKEMTPNESLLVSKRSAGFSMMPGLVFQPCFCATELSDDEI